MEKFGLIDALLQLLVREEEFGFEARMGFREDLKRTIESYEEKRDNKA